MESWKISTLTRNINKTRGTSDKEIENEMFGVTIVTITCLKSVDFDGATISIYTNT